MSYSPPGPGTMPDTPLGLCAHLWREGERKRGREMEIHASEPRLTSGLPYSSAIFHVPGPRGRHLVSHSSSHPVISKGPSPHNHQTPIETESEFVSWGSPHKGPQTSLETCVRGGWVVTGGSDLKSRRVSRAGSSQAPGEGPSCLSSSGGPGGPGLVATLLCHLAHVSLLGPRASSSCDNGIAAPARRSPAAGGSVTVGCLLCHEVAQAEKCSLGKDIFVADFGS